MDNTTIAGIFAGLFGLLSTMLGALTLSQKSVIAAHQESRKECREDLKICLAESRSNTEKSYALVGAFTQVKDAVVVGFAENARTQGIMQENNRLLNDLAKRSRSRSSS